MKSSNHPSEGHHQNPHPDSIIPEGTVHPPPPIVFPPVQTSLWSSMESLLSIPSRSRFCLLGISTDYSRSSNDRRWRSRMKAWLFVSRRTLSSSFFRRFRTGNRRVNLHDNYTKQKIISTRVWKIRSSGNFWSFILKLCCCGSTELF